MTLRLGREEGERQLVAHVYSSYVLEEILPIHSERRSVQLV